MKIEETGIEGLLIIHPEIYRDHRGYFYESYNQKKAKERGISQEFIQDNQSASTRGVLRGLHYQTGEHAQSKLVRVILGAVQDVAVDIRPESPTYGQHRTVTLTADNHLQFLIPRGFAHGFLVLSDYAVFSYKCDGYYNKESEGGIRYDDSELNIHWQLPTDTCILSEKDQSLPSFGSHKPF